MQIVIWILWIVTLAFFEPQAATTSAPTARFHEPGRADVFAGLGGDEARLDNAMGVCAMALAPDNVGVLIPRAARFLADEYHRLRGRQQARTSCAVPGGVGTTCLGGDK